MIHSAGISSGRAGSDMKHHRCHVSHAEAVEAVDVPASHGGDENRQHAAVVGMWNAHGADGRAAQSRLDEVVEALGVGCRRSCQGAIAQPQRTIMRGHGACSRIGEHDLCGSVEQDDANGELIDHIELGTLQRLVAVEAEAEQ
jgi:hypothetical protein